MNVTNFNADLFCNYNTEPYKHCSLTKSEDYNRPRNYDPQDTRTISQKQVGLFLPHTYTFTPQGLWLIRCGSTTFLERK